MSLTKNQVKFIASLSQKKNRDAFSLFIAEGNKIVADLLPYFCCDLLVCTELWREEHSHSLRNVKEVIVVSHDDLKRVSAQRSPQHVLAVFKKKPSLFDVSVADDSLVLALDCVQDPGNLGTIIRVADWFGIKHIICSEDTVDVYNPKVVQSTMGAIGRVSVSYCDLVAVLSSLPKNIPVYGTFLDGESIYEKTLTPNGVIVMGNEGNGVSASVEQLVSRRLLIPNYPSGAQTSESLNVAVATAITCSEFRRRFISENII